MESLHPSFLKDLKCLFDILDTENQGCVRLSDIEQYWRMKKAQGGLSDSISILPNDFIESLKRVAHASGLLSFQRFCSGIKIALCKDQLKDAPVRSRPFSAGRRRLNRPRSYIRAVGCESDDEDKVVDPSNVNNTHDKSIAKTIIAEVLPEDTVHPTGSEEFLGMINTSTSLDLNSNGSFSKTEEKKNSKNNLFRSKDNSTTDGLELHESTLFSLGLINGFGIERGRLLSISTRDSRSEGSTDETEAAALKENGHHSARTSSSSSLASSVLSAEDQSQILTLENIDDEINVLHEGLDSIQRAREWFLKRIAALQEEKLYLEKNEKEKMNSLSSSHTLEGRRKELNIKIEDLYCYTHRIKDFNDILDRLTIPPSKAEQRRSIASRTKQRKTRELSEELLHKKLKEQKEQMAKLEQDKVELVRELFQTRLKMAKLQDSKVVKAPATPF